MNALLDVGTGLILTETALNALKQFILATKAVHQDTKTLPRGHPVRGLLLPTL